MQIIFLWECTGCKRRTHVSTKNKSKHADKLHSKKFCKWCRRHVDHKEVKS